MSIYTACKSGIIQRGEELFPMVSLQTHRDYNRIVYFMEKIPRGGERLMSTEKVLELYD